MIQPFTSGYLSKENENTNSKIYMDPHVYCSIIYNSQIWKQSVHQQIDG